MHVVLFEQGKAPRDFHEQKKDMRAHAARVLYADRRFHHVGNKFAEGVIDAGKVWDDHIARFGCRKRFQTRLVDERVIVDGQDAVYAEGVVFGALARLHFHIVNNHLLFVDHEAVEEVGVEKNQFPLMHRYGKNFRSVFGRSSLRHDFQSEISLTRVHKFEIHVVVHSHVERGGEFFDVARHRLQFAAAYVLEMQLFHDFILTRRSGKFNGKEKILDEFIKFSQKYTILS